MRRGYWLYLPREYIEADEAARQARRWPLVVTFHGMKPFDCSSAQAREWEQEADRYGFIVVAPDLRAPDILRQFPVRNVGTAFKSDENTTIAILDHVFVTTNADRQNVLSTSWSSGGYMAHYMLNQHPDRFTCLAVRQSNFSSSILGAALTARSRHHPILILNTQNDFGIVKRECREANKWYEGHGYTNFGWVELKNLGHERTPDTAAAFFAGVSGVKPNRAPTVLARRQAIAGNSRGLALLANEALLTRPATQSPPDEITAVAANTPQTYPRNARSPDNSWQRGARPTVRRPVEPPPGATNMTSTHADTATPPLRPRSPLSIRVSSAIGTEPMVLAFSADCPADWHRGANFLWTLDGDPICSGVNGQKTITQSGEHTLGLLVITSKGEEHRAYRLVRVLPHIESGAPIDSRR
ncbi:MAG: PHB depolymerase family esterase [Planctomycetota bacterium]